MKRAKKINVFSFVLFQATIWALIGLVAGIVYSFGGFVYDVLVSLNLITSTETPGLSYGTALAFGALIGMPLIFTILGLLLGLIEAIVYTIFAKWLGGITVNFEE